MSAQTSYSILTDARFHGSLADLNNNEIDSLKAEGGAIGFGVIVSSGTDDDQGVIGVVAGKIKGITIRDLNREGALSTAAIGYAETDPMSILRTGRISLTIPTGGNKDDQLLVNDTTGIIDVGTAGAGETQLNAFLEETVAAGVVGLVRAAFAIA